MNPKLVQALGLAMMSNLSYQKPKYERPYETEAEEKARKTRRVLKDKSKNKKNAPWK